MAVYTLNPLDDGRWTAFITGHPHASVFHSVGWIQALKRTYHYEPVVYTTTPPDRPLTNGILLCRVDSWLTGRRMVSVPFADHCEPLVESGTDRAELLDALRSSTGHGWNYVELRPRHPDGWIEPGEEPDAVFRLHTLDLRPSLDELVGRFHKSTILRKIRRAEREGIEYEEGRSAPLLDEFFRLMLLTRRRHGVPPQPIEWFANLLDCVREAKLVVARWRGEPVAAMLTILHGRTLVYKYGGSDSRLHPLGAMPFLFLRAIAEAKPHGAITLDLGRSDLHNQGLIRFKERLGASSTALAYQRISHQNRRRRTVVWRPTRLAGRVVSRLPDWLFVSAGRFFYPHVG